MADAIVVGGGFFGCSLALHLQRGGARVTLLEREPELLSRASWNNQARVHHGYHYPRSLLTGLRSRVNYPRFVAEFSDCVERGFRHLYAVARRRSHVTARQFETFCRRIGAPLRPASPADRALFDDALIEQVWEADELAFDVARLRQRLRAALREVDVRLGAEARAFLAGPRVELTSGEVLEAPRIFHCTYSALNRLLAASGLELIPLRHELTELCIVEVPAVLQRLAVTVMCGPFFSLMPFPSLQAHSFSHVRYTPHCAWEERAAALAPPDGVRASHFIPMRKDAERYVPVLAELDLKQSLWEVKTVLPQAEHDDARPILLRRSEKLPGLVSILGGKLDNVYDVAREL